MSRYVDLDGLTWDGNTIISKVQEVKTRHGYMQGITVGWLWGDNVPHIDMAEHDAEVINKFAEELKIRLGDAIYPKDLESMKNLIDDVVKDQKNDYKNN